MKNKISKYKFKDDRYRTLAGKILLLKYLKKNTKYNLDNIFFTKYNKPYIKNFNLNFNISHAGRYAIAVFGEYEQLGVDIEDSINNIDIDDFKSVLSDYEFDKIKNSKSKLEDFYTLWTTKEAVLKADGRGITEKIEDVIIEGDKAFFNKKKYYLNTFKIDTYIYTIAYTI